MVYNCGLEGDPAHRRSANAATVSSSARSGGGISMTTRAGAVIIYCSL